jgi:hypothetical protein
LDAKDAILTLGVMLAVGLVCQLVARAPRMVALLVGGLAIVVTLGVQTTTKVWLGRRLGLEERSPELGDVADLSAP